jgi:hypothetical protein
MAAQSEGLWHGKRLSTEAKGTAVLASKASPSTTTEILFFITAAN